MLERISAVTVAICEAIAAFAIAVLAVLVAYVVVARYAFHQTPHWAEELPRLILVWATFLGGVVCSFGHSHLMGGLLPVLVKNSRLLAIIYRVNHVLIIGALMFLLVAGWRLTSVTMHHAMTTLDLPAGVVYLALPVGCAAALIVHLHHLLAPAAPGQG